MNAILSVLIFVIVYFFIVTEKINKTIVAVVGASLMILLKLVDFETAVRAVDLNVIFLLVGMMTAVSILAKTGFFEWTATSLAKKTKGNPILIMLTLLVLTGVFSAALDNVTTVILLVPVTILIAQILEISPIPFVVLEAISSNIGGSATLIGDPPNIIIGSQAELSFNAFLTNLGPAILLIMGVFLLTVYMVFRNKLKVPENVRNRLVDSVPALAIVDKTNMIKALIGIGLIMTGFFLHSFLHLEPGIIALGGSMILMVACKSKVDKAMLQVEWGVIFFFIGLFMMIAALEHNGVLEMIANGMLKVAGDNLFALCIVILWGSAIISSLLDNIPFVITMVPMLKICIPVVAKSLGITDAAEISHIVAEPIWWCLALGACLGGNGTLIGASANIVSAHICKKNNYNISFMLFSKYGAFFMVQSMVLSTGYIWLRYFYLR